MLKNKTDYFEIQILSIIYPFLCFIIVQNNVHEWQSNRSFKLKWFYKIETLIDKIKNQSF